MERCKTIIVGAGLAGLSTALHLDGDAVVLERKARPGGLAVTEFEEGFGFDVTGHWLHMRDPDIRARLGGLASMRSVVRQSKIRAYDRFVAYPFQSNLKDVPHDVRMECIIGAVEAHCRRVAGVPEPLGFDGFVRHHFGEGIAREFMFPYNTKLWGVPPEAISHAWCQRFVPVPDLRQILEGCFSDANEASGYNATFSYPESGGIGTFAAAMAQPVSQAIRTGVEVLRIHGGERWLETAEGNRLAFDHLVSTMPLKTLVERLVDAPDAVREAGRQLACTSETYFNLGLDRPALAGQHWLYLPDPTMAVYRIGSFSNAIPYMAPEGCSSLYVELANDRESDDDAVLDETLALLSAIGPTVGRENVKVWQKRTIDFAYVIYDHVYEAARKTIFDHLEELGIQSIGRYGSWVYASMEDALMEGREAARRIAAAGRQAPGSK